MNSNSQNPIETIETDLLDIMEYMFYQSTGPSCNHEAVVDYLQRLPLRERKEILLGAMDNFIDMVPPNVMIRIIRDVKKNWYRLALQSGYDMRPEAFVRKYDSRHRGSRGSQRTQELSEAKDIYNSVSSDENKEPLESLISDDIETEIFRCILPRISRDEIIEEIKTIPKRYKKYIVSYFANAVYANPDENRIRNGIFMLYHANVRLDSFIGNSPAMNSLREHMRRFIDRRRGDVATSLTLGSGGLPPELSHKIAEMEFTNRRSRSRKPRRSR